MKYEAIIYNPSPITLKSHCTISQQAYLCSATHDYDDPAFPVISEPITVGWLCLDLRPRNGSFGCNCRRRRRTWARIGGEQKPRTLDRLCWSTGKRKSKRERNTNDRKTKDRSRNVECCRRFVWDTDEHTQVHHFIAKPITDQLRAHSASDVLDLGCGNGSFSALMASSGFNVTGVDHSSSGIEIASKKHPNASFAQHDITQPLPTGYHGKFRTP